MRGGKSVLKQLAEEGTPSVSYTPFRETIYEYVREQIISGALPKGTLFSDGEIAALFKTSRTPVREAVQKLEAEGLVDRIPMKGNIVKGLSLEEVSQVYLIRRTLECLAVRQATDRITDKELDRMEELIGLAEKVLAQRLSGDDTLAALYPLTREFNMILLEACKLSRLIDLIWQQRDLLVRFNLLRRVLGAHPSRRITTRRNVYKALRARDAEAAASAWGEHVDSSFAIWRDLSSQLVLEAGQGGESVSRLAAQYSFGRKSRPST